MIEHPAEKLAEDICGSCLACRRECSILNRVDLSQLEGAHGTPETLFPLTLGVLVVFGACLKKLKLFETLVRASFH